MHGALRALEFDRMTEALRSFALTPVGAAALARLRPSIDPRLVAQAIAATSEAVRFLEEHRSLPLRAPADLDTTLLALAIEGRALEPLHLLGLADFLDSVHDAGSAVRQMAGGPLPALQAVADRVASFEREVSDVRQAIDPSGEVVDQASAELRTVRERLRRQRARLRSLLESYVRGKETCRYLQEQVITERGGRYVLTVRTEHRSSIPGIVHGSSHSGASLFLEPLSTVEVNNEIVALQQQEAEEVYKVLLTLTNAFRTRAFDVHRTIEAATELDVLQAKARLAQITHAVEPAPAEDGTVELRGARHPLLMPALVRLLEGGRDDAAGSGCPVVPASDPVPVDILIGSGSSVLVISGPNTGGKTVALKTVGLLALMAQSGLHVPAASARLPVFRSIFVDVGDEQSIAANLSTFSWHVTNIAAMDRALAIPALVLLDEVGAGTDPVEGGALGTAIVDHFRKRGAIVVATTHSDRLKTYAPTTEGVISAACGFDPDTFAPTYRLVYGSPGRSLALEIAARLGLNGAILESARGYLGTKEVQLAEHLAKVDQDIKALDHERRLLDRERQSVAADDARVGAREAALKQREALLRRELDAKLDDHLREARREIDAVVDDLKRRAAALSADASAGARLPAISTGDIGTARAAARTALDAVRERARNPMVHAGDAVRPVEEHRVDVGERPDVGDRVAIGGLSVEGTLIAAHDREAEVDVQGKRLRVPLDELRRVAHVSAARCATVNVSVHLQPRDGSPADLNVIGCTVDEAISRADKFLDEALLAELRTIRVIHGHGSGQLRRAIAGFLQGHLLVARFASAPPEQGGGGVTVVELKE